MIRYFFKKKYKNWSCPQCMQDMFVFSNENDEFIEQTNFNSNFNCSCQANIMKFDKSTREVQRLRYNDIF